MKFKPGDVVFFKDNPEEVGTVRSTTTTGNQLVYWITANNAGPLDGAMSAYEHQIEFWFPTVKYPCKVTQPTRVCECGAESVGYTTHSEWCPKRKAIV